MATDYVAFSEQVKSKFFEMMCDDASWIPVKTSDGVQIWSRPSSEMKGTILKGEATVECSPKQLFDFVHPMKPYRVQWDSFLDYLKVGEQFAPGVYLVYHVTKSVLKIISPRESLDVAVFGETDECYYVAAAGVEHPSFPPNPKYVHVKQFPCGFKIFKDSGEPGKTKFRMLFNVDLQMNALTAFVAEQLKPTLMVEEVQHIRHGLKTIAYTPDSDPVPKKPGSGSGTGLADAEQEQQAEAVEKLEELDLGSEDTTTSCSTASDSTSSGCGSAPVSPKKE